MLSLSQSCRLPAKSVQRCASPKPDSSHLKMGIKDGWNYLSCIIVPLFPLTIDGAVYLWYTAKAPASALKEEAHICPWSCFLRGLFGFGSITEIFHMKIQPTFHIESRSLKLASKLLPSVPRLPQSHPQGTALLQVSRCFVEVTTGAVMVKSGHFGLLSFSTRLQCLG